MKRSTIGRQAGVQNEEGVGDSRAPLVTQHEMLEQNTGTRLGQGHSTRTLYLCDGESGRPLLMLPLLPFTELGGVALCSRVFFLDIHVPVFLLIPGLVALSLLDTRSWHVAMAAQVLEIKPRLAKLRAIFLSLLSSVLRRHTCSATSGLLSF